MKIEAMLSRGRKAATFTVTLTPAIHKKLLISARTSGLSRYREAARLIQWALEQNNGAK